MGELAIALAITSAIGVYQVEEQKEQAEEMENRQKEAERKADLTSELQRQRDVAERDKEKNLLPPILGSADKTPGGIDALIKPVKTGIQTGSQAGSASDSGVQI